MYRQIIDIDTGEVSTTAIQRVADRAGIPINESNIDYQAYLAWVAEGNTILPPE